ncbi:MAG: glycosyl hydrolase family 2, partial [Deltaproteobacteria bacterium]
LPSTIEKTEIGQFDGIVWYRRTVDIPSDWAGKEMTVSLGVVDDQDVTWFNGTKIGGLNDNKQSRNYKIDGSLVKTGKNTLVVRIQDNGGAGGFMGKPEEMLLTSGDKKTSIAGPWLYKVGSKRSAWPRTPRGLPRINARYPSALFNGMISPLTSTTIKGVIWYQGENDVTGLAWYKPLFPNLIQSWRDAWGLGDFPFYHVQLPPYDYGNTNSALFREVQMKSLSMKYVGIAVTLDVGDFKNIHPPHKKEVGERLALWALAKDYGKKDLVFSGPLYKGMKIEGSKIRLSFDHTGSGMVAKDCTLTNFVIAGADKKFVPAMAKVDKDTIVVSSDKVAKPVAVRYAFDNAGVPSLFNKEGLPASSFRTDDQ